MSKQENFSQVLETSVGQMRGTAHQNAFHEKNLIQARCDGYIDGLETARKSAVFLHERAMKEKDELILELFRLIDDIDTASDVTEDLEVYRRVVDELCAFRHTMISAADVDALYKRFPNTPEHDVRVLNLARIVHAKPSK